MEVVDSPLLPVLSPAWRQVAQQQAWMIDYTLRGLIGSLSRLFVR